MPHLPWWKPKSKPRTTVVWGKEKKRLKTKRFTILLIFIFLFFLFASFIVKCVSQLKNKVWQKNQRLNLIVVTNPLFVLSVEPKGKSLGVVVIPPDSFVEVVRGKGPFKLESVYELGGLEGKAGQLLTETTQEFLGVPIDGWIDPGEQFRAKKLKLDKEEFIRTKNKLASFNILLKPGETINFLQKGLKTNLTTFDLLRLWFVIQKVRFDKIRFVDLSLNNVFSDLILADGTVVKKGDQIKIDEKMKKIFSEENLMAESLNIEVLNGTETPGLAQKAARILNNIGARVTWVGNSEEKTKKCLLKYEGKLFNSVTLKRIDQIFDNCAHQQLKEEKTRAPIIIVLGEDYRKFLFGK